MKKTVIITGASSGMGKEFAIQLEKKYSFDEYWLIARNEKRLHGVAALLKTPCKIISGDLTDEEFIKNFNGVLQAEQPKIFALVNGAGYGKMNKVESVSYADNVGMIDLNAKTLFSFTYFCLPYMEEGAKIINIGSFSSFEPLPYMSVYAATKAFVLSFTRSLNVELKPRKIRAVALCPMWVKTEFFDRANTDKIINNYPHLYKADWVVAKCIKALEGKKDYIVPGIYAKLNRFMVKFLPHKLVMNVFLKQQGIKQ